MSEANTPLIKQSDIYNDVEGQSEDALQQKCYFWFWNTYPELRGLLFSVPNGGFRNSREAARMKLTGTVSGVSDLIFLYKGKARMIELKKDAFSCQSKNQKDWEAKVQNQGFDYDVVRSLFQFKRLIESIVED